MTLDNALVRELQTTGRLQPGSHMLHKPLIFDNWAINRVFDLNGCVFFGQPLVFSARKLVVKNATVENSFLGFIYTRGQGSLFESLEAHNCTIGHYFGVQNRMENPLTFGRNSQVAWSTFTNLLSLNCGTGFYWDGYATHNRSWCNANLFNMMVARECDLGFKTLAHQNEKGSSGCNYNMFNVIQCEANKLSLNCPDWHNATINGAHLVTSGPEDVMQFGRNCHALGGRWMGNYSARNMKASVGGINKNLIGEVTDGQDLEA